ncbi:unnamed protein product [Mytilus coruscus]|uniref:DDE Tnp4 domain-containing protein n=1 Tax=Mytilus coruscus TaxID=42192 RepID=A0A6J8DJW3_MYTCO|nr:unnamed protein product [Mytilus coruscus]
MFYVNRKLDTRATLNMEDEVDNNMQCFMFIWNMTGLDNLSMARHTQLNNLAFTIASLLRRPHIPQITCYAEIVIPTLTPVIDLIKWPNSISREFQLKSGIKGIIGAMDGSLIRLASCPKGDSDYINREGFPSIQLQVISYICITQGSKWEIIGCNKFLIADSAYPIKPYLIPPFKDNCHISNSQKKFNKVIYFICKSNSGKGIWPSKRSLQKPSAIVGIIVCGCTILHNLTIINDNNIEQFMDDNQDGQPNGFQNIFRNDNAGVRVRENLMRTLA